MNEESPFSPNPYFDPTYEAWKLSHHLPIHLKYLYFDPTYEAWKLRKSASALISWSIISILPTRHGNREKKPIIHNSFHISILPTRHGNERKCLLCGNLKDISILPTRHGNVSAINLHLHDLLLFRSYLRGMETPFPKKRPFLVIFYFDPTYEAWKLLLSCFFPLAIPNFDPTYEAWKLLCLSVIPLTNDNFDPTYEAWKRRRKKYGC